MKTAPLLYVGLVQCKNDKRKRRSIRPQKLCSEHPLLREDTCSRSVKKVVYFFTLLLFRSRERYTAFFFFPSGFKEDSLIASGIPESGSILSVDLLEELPGSPIVSGWDDVLVSLININNLTSTDFLALGEGLARVVLVFEGLVLFLVGDKVGFDGNHLEVIVRVGEFTKLVKGRRARYTSLDELHETQRGYMRDMLLILVCGIALLAIALLAVPLAEILGQGGRSTASGSRS